MRKKILASFIICLGLLVACSTGNGDDMKNAAHSSMDMGEMKDADIKDKDHSAMQMDHDSVAELKSSQGKNELTFPKVLKPDQRDKDTVTYTIRAQQGSSDFFDGVSTKTLGYNGDFLGPVVRVEKGMNVTIHLVNDLKEDTTFHWHGLEVPGNDDGGLHKVLKPGEKQTIHFQVRQDAATLWFHPHPMHETGKQVFEGLAGLLYIDDNNSIKANVPKTYGEDDFPIILQDKQFTDDKQLDYDKVRDDDGTTGETLLINGIKDPKLTTERKKVRLRILNGSNRRNYNLHFDNDMAFEQIASDGGFLNKPYKTKKLEVAPAERVEIVVDLTKLKGDTVTLMNGKDKTLLPIHLKGFASHFKTAPTNTSNNLKLTDEIKNMKVTKKIKLAGMDKHVTINDKKFDPDRIDFTQKQNVVEVWEIENVKDMMGGMKHPFHIHGTQYQVISVDGKKTPKHLSGLKDTISLEPGQKAKIAVKFPKKGVYMFHCHILEHEDNGMMGQIKVD